MVAARGCQGVDEEFGGGRKPKWRVWSGRGSRSQQAQVSSWRDFHIHFTVKTPRTPFARQTKSALRNNKRTTGAILLLNCIHLSSFEGMRSVDISIKYVPLRLNSHSEPQVTTQFLSQVRPNPQDATPLSYTTLLRPRLLLAQHSVKRLAAWMAWAL